MVDMLKSSFVKNINSKNYLISQSREENMANPKKKQNWRQIQGQYRLVLFKNVMETWATLGHPLPIPASC